MRAEIVLKVSSKHITKSGRKEGLARIFGRYTVEGREGEGGEAMWRSVLLDNNSVPHLLPKRH